MVLKIDGVDLTNLNGDVSVDAVGTEYLTMLKINGPAKNYLMGTIVLGYLTTVQYRTIPCF